MYDPKQQTYTKTEYDIVRAENSDLCDNVDAARQDLEDCLLGTLEEKLQVRLDSANHDYEELLKERTDYVDENKRLRKFARHIIRQYCWNIEEPDGGDIQEWAEKLGLIVPHLATKDDVDDENDFGIGDTIFKFSDMLNNESKKTDAPRDWGE